MFSNEVFGRRHFQGLLCFLQIEHLGFIVNADVMVASNDKYDLIFLRCWISFQNELDISGIWLVNDSDLCFLPDSIQFEWKRSCRTTSAKVFQRPCRSWMKPHISCGFFFRKTVRFCRFATNNQPLPRISACITLQEQKNIEHHFLGGPYSREWGNETIHGYDGDSFPYSQCFEVRFVLRWLFISYHHLGVYVLFIFHHHLKFYIQESAFGYEHFVTGVGSSHDGDDLQ